MEFLKRMHGWMELTRKIDFLGPLAIRLYLAPIFILAGMNKLDQSIEMYEKALAIEPDNPDALGGIASIYERRREYEKAAELIEPYIKNAAPTRLAVVYGDLSRKLKHTEKAITVLENTLLQDNTTQENCIDLHYTLGKIYDQTEQFARHPADRDRGPQD